MFLVGTRAGEGDDETKNFVAVGDIRWPKPWLFARMFVFGTLLYFAFRISFGIFDNPNLIPGLQIIGAFAVPLSVVIFYFEMNAPRNVPLYVVIKYVMLGGIASLAFSLVGFQTLSATNPMSAGPIEEIGKATALILMVRIARYRWTLNGLLFGGAIGAGFAGFETAGYALQPFFKGIALLSNGQSVGIGQLSNAMVSTLTLRAVMAPGGHVVWTAIVGAALWRVKGDRPFKMGMVTDRRFLSALAFTTVMHAIWNSPLNGKLGTYTVPAILMVIAWLVLLMYVQHGLGEWGAAHGVARSMVSGSDEPRMADPNSAGSKDGTPPERPEHGSAPGLSGPA